jgi:SAM-dependent methyltransferase
MNVNWDHYTEKLEGGTATNYDLLKKFAKGVVLDVGCGTGKHLSILDNENVRIGIDPGITGLRKGKGKFPQLKLMCGSTYEFPLQSKVCDSVVMIDVIEHLEYPSLALNEIYRVLKPRGFLFVQTPNYPVKRLYDFLHWLRGSRQDFVDDPTHVSKFSSFRLVSAVLSSGLLIKVVVSRNLVFDEYFHKLRYLRGTKIGQIVGQKTIIIAQKHLED